MYLNFEILEKKGFSWKENELLVLLCIRQKEYERLEPCRDVLLSLHSKGYVVKLASHPKNKPSYLGARLTMKSKALIRELQIAEITPESTSLAASLVSLYEQYNLNIGNKKKIVELVAWFMAETQDYTPEQVYEAVENYVSTTEKTYISALNNLLWKGESTFSTTWSLSQSKLYTLLTKN